MTEKGESETRVEMIYIIMNRNSGGNMKIHIKVIKDPDMKSKVTETILRTLPEWFGIEEAIQNYILGVRNQTFYALLYKNEIIGFTSIVRHNPYTAEVYVMAILREYHRRNLGTQLVKQVAEKLKQESFKFLMVKTLGKSHPDVHYAKTRCFYEKVGFYPLEEIKEIWGEQNPCLIMIKPL